ncbi:MULTISPECIES: Trm112 family protein [unclassified Bartonella]|uniref:Trm112 family protein n=1 Tax=unclassified Bartonella TaxID=2645622 RepID=UPI00235E440D|nr:MULTISPECIES: Trm112 family protein [unclassified Bartonella]
MKKMITDPKMLELLVCPLTGGILSLNRNTQELISLKAKLAYPIRDGVPIMLASEARPLHNNELARQ